MTEFLQVYNRTVYITDIAGGNLERPEKGHINLDLGTLS